MAAVAAEDTCHHVAAGGVICREDAVGVGVMGAEAASMAEVDEEEGTVEVVESEGEAMVWGVVVASRLYGATDDLFTRSYRSAHTSAPFHYYRITNPHHINYSAILAFQF